MSAREDVERVRALREAYVQGASDRDYATYNSRCSDPEVVPSDPRERMTASVAAARRYPMPVRDVPRVVSDDRYEYRIRDGHLEWRHIGNVWIQSMKVDAMTSASVIDLLSSPSRTVPADEVQDD